MSATLLVWLSLFCLFTLLAFVRPVWGACLYMLTFFACPGLWWWGKGTIGHYRWVLVAGVIHLIAVIVANSGSRGRRIPQPKYARLGTRAIVFLAVNATAVHFLLAQYGRMSLGPYTELMKFSLLAVLIIYSIRNESDLRILAFTLVIGAAYIGYEATFNDRGGFRAGRLEGLMVPSAGDSNGMANLMATLLPITATLVLAGRHIGDRLLGIACAGLITNVILLCNSRGAFLGTICGMGMLLVSSPPKIRRRALGAIGIGAIGLMFLLGDPRIVERFMTTFDSGGERDHSAASRLDYWKAGLSMVQDYPFGAGGDGFHDQHGSKYLRRLGYDFDARSVHNGYINEMCDWGIQGLILRLLFLGFAMAAARQAALLSTRRNDPFYGMLGASLIAGMTTFAVQSVFGDFLDNEWGYWMAGFCIAYARLVALRYRSVAPRPTVVQPIAAPPPDVARPPAYV